MKNQKFRKEDRALAKANPAYKQFLKSVEKKVLVAKAGDIITVNGKKFIVGFVTKFETGSIIVGVGQNVQFDVVLRILGTNNFVLHSKENYNKITKNPIEEMLKMIA